MYTVNFQYHQVGNPQKTYLPKNLPSFLATLFTLILVSVGNMTLAHILYQITQENSTGINISEYYDFKFLFSACCYAFALSISARLIKSKCISFSIVIFYIMWIHVLKWYCIGLPMDLTICIFLYLHLLSTFGINVVCFFGMYLFDHPLISKKIFSCILFVICFVFIDIKFERNPFIYLLLRVDYNIKLWNEYGYNSKHIDNTITDHWCPIFIDNRKIPWLDIIPNRWANFYLGHTYYCKSEEFSFIDFDTDILTVHCDESELDIHFGSDYLMKYEAAAKHRFDGNHLNQFMDWQSIQLRAGLTVQFDDNNVHRIDLKKLSSIIDYQTEMLTIECGTNIDTHFIPHQTKESKSKQPKHLLDDNNNDLPSSILMFVIDATSRQDFHRKLTKTSSILEKISSQNASSSHELYEFMRVNIVGHSTSRNLGPLFFGNWDEIVDDSLWSVANQNGFATGLIWDQCDEPPYWDDAFHNRSSHLTPDNINMVGCAPDFDCFGNQGFINSGKGSISLNDKCNYQKMVHQHMLEYQTFLHKWNNQNNVFSISHTNIGHDGVGVAVISVDDYLAEWLQRHVIDSNVLDDTLILIMSDHGMHFGVPILTDVGELEHHLSTALWLYPKKRLNDDINEKLRHNEQSLLSVFDFRNTILSLVNPNGDIDVHSVHDGMNIMKEIVPYNRTCKDVGVSDSRCVCMNDDGTYKYFQ